MTVAAGFVCFDGIVLCSDSQESLGDYKFPVEKIETFSDESTRVAIAGSGLGPLVDSAVQRIGNAVLGAQDHDSVERQIRHTLADAYSSEFNLYPATTEDERLIDILIAVRLRQHPPRLYHATGPVLRHVREYAVIGSGRAVQYSIHSLYSKHIMLRQCLLIAVQLLSIAQGALTSVGGGRIVTLSEFNTDFDEIDEVEIREIEQALGYFAHWTGRVLLDFGDIQVSNKQFAASLRELQNRLMPRREDYLRTALRNRTEYRKRRRELQEMEREQLKVEKTLEKLRRDGQTQKSASATDKDP